MIRAVTRTINTLGGGSSIYLSSSLQRHARDAEAITHHFTVAQHTWEETGRVLLGRQPAVPMFRVRPRFRLIVRERCGERPANSGVHHIRRPRARTRL
jgi:hypothetical protein